MKPQNEPEETVHRPDADGLASVQAKGFRNSAMTGFIAAIVFLGAGIPLIVFANNSAGSNLAGHLLLLFIVFISMAAFELFCLKTYRLHFSFSKAKHIGQDALKRVLSRCFALAILSLAGAIPIIIIDRFYAPVLNVYIVVLPAVFLFAALYFFLVERYGSNETRTDEWLRLSECSRAAADCAVKRFSLAELKRALLDKQVQNILLGALLRTHFSALLLVYYVLNFQALENYTNQLVIYFQNWQAQQMLSLLPISFMALLRLLCTFDCAIGAIGYLGASRLLGTELRSVDKTWTAWIVTLICYNPFCPFDTFAVFSYAWPESWLRLCPIAWCVASALLLVLMLLYVWANMTFGMAFCNLANRGIVANGPYSFVRHPAYASKLAVWWICTVPLCLESDWGGALSIIVAMLAITLIFYMRAMTEENHLLSDPSYREYCMIVPWRFIPAIF